MKIFGTMALTAALAAGSAATADSFNANIFFPDKHPLALHGYVEWAEAVRNESNGELSPTVYTGTVLLPARSGLSGVRDGIAQIGYHAGTYTPAELPISNALQELGFNYTDPLVAMLAASDLNMTYAAAIQQWSDAGVVYGGGYSTPPYNLMCRTAIRSVEDLKGQRLRTAGAALSTWAESIGAVPVNVPSSEMYQGLERGTLDCAVNVASDLQSRSLWDVSKFTTMAPLGMYWSGPMWAYDQDFWDSLTPEHRRVLFNTHATALANLYVGYADSVQEALALAADQGVEVIEPDEAFLSAIASFAESNKSAAVDNAREKFGIENPEEIFAEFDARIEKWATIFADVDRGDAEAIAELIKVNLYDQIDVTTFGG